MAQFTPSEDFTARVMAEVRAVHQREQDRLLMVERLLGRLPIRTLLSLVAVAGTIWNLARIVLMFSPVACR